MGRVFWAITEGAVAIALLQAGGTQSLKALQAVSIIAGLPFTVILMFMCTGIWRALKIDQGHMALRQNRTDWCMPLYGGVFDIFEFILSLGKSAPQVLAQMARQVTEEVKPKKVIEEVKPDKTAVEVGLTQA